MAWYGLVDTKPVPKFMFYFFWSQRLVILSDFRAEHSQEPVADSTGGPSVLFPRMGSCFSACSRRVRWILQSVRSRHCCGSLLTEVSRPSSHPLLGHSSISLILYSFLHGLVTLVGGGHCQLGGGGDEGPTPSCVPR